MNVGDGKEGGSRGKGSEVERGGWKIIGRLSTYILDLQMSQSVAPKCSKESYRESYRESDNVEF